MSAARKFVREGALYVPSRELERPRLELVPPHAGLYRRDVLRAPLGALSSSIARDAPAPTPPPVTSLQWFGVVMQNAQITSLKSGNGDQLSFSGSQVILIDAATGFGTGDPGQRITIAGAAIPANNGSFWGIPNPGGNQFPYRNALGASEGAYAGAWALQGKFAQITELAHGRVFSQGTAAQQPAVISDGMGGRLIWAHNPEFSSRGALNLADAAVATLFTSTDVSVSVRMQLPTGSIYPTQDLCSIRASAGSNLNRISFGFSNATTAVCTYADGAAGTDLTATCVVPASTWFTAGFRLNRAARTVSYYQDGVFVATGAAGTNRTQTGLTTCSWGSANTNGTTNYILEGFAAADAGWNASEFMAVHQAFLAYGCL